MTTLAELATNFAGGEVPPVLEPVLAKLLAFQAEHGFESYSECFGLLADDKTGLRSWSSDANEMPDIVFGDQGGVHVIAEDVSQLLRLLTFDIEPMVDHDGVTYYRAKDHEPRDNHDAYVDWLKVELHLDPTDDPASLVAAAQSRYNADFDAWMSAFVAG